MGWHGSWGGAAADMQHVGEPTQSAERFRPVRRRHGLLTRGGGERLRPGVLVRRLLPIVHLLPELFGFLVVGEGETGEAAFELEGVEEDAVLVIGEGVVDLLIPYYASTGRLVMVSQVQRTRK